MGQVNIDFNLKAKLNDFPVDPPLPSGQYLQAHAQMKVKFELAYSLSQPNKEIFPGATFEVINA